MCEGTVLENLAKFVDDTLTNMKKCLDKVLDLRGKYRPHNIQYNSHLIQVPREVLIQWNVKSLNILPLGLYKNQTYKFGQCNLQD
jgi:galactose-1-phosphate uridylyltransferase